MSALAWGSGYLNSGLLGYMSYVYVATLPPKLALNPEPT